jgi:cytochrome c oxidase assembly protein subunit 15
MFAVPLVVLVAKKNTRAAISRGGLTSRLLLLFTLGGTQGLVGWWMVKSGLEHEHILGFDRDELEMPRVSPYRRVFSLILNWANPPSWVPSVAWHSG